MKITKRQLRRIIKEEKSMILSEDQNHPMFDEDPELGELGEIVDSLIHYSTLGSRIMDGMGSRYGELVHLNTKTRQIENLIRELADNFDMALDDIMRYENT